MVGIGFGIVRMNLGSGFGTISSLEETRVECTGTWQCRDIESTGLMRPKYGEISILTHYSSLSYLLFVLGQQFFRLDYAFSQTLKLTQLEGL